MTEQIHHIPIEQTNSKPQTIEVGESFGEFNLPEQAPDSKAAGEHILAAMEKQSGSVDEAISETANRVTTDNDEYVSIERG